MTNYYCNDDSDAIRGRITSPSACYQACLSLSNTNGKQYHFFDLTTDGAQQCWCGSTCSSRVSYPTVTYAIDDAVCISHAPTDAPTASPTTRSPTNIVLDYP